MRYGSGVAPSEKEPSIMAEKKKSPDFTPQPDSAAILDITCESGSVEGNPARRITVKAIRDGLEGQVVIPENATALEALNLVKAAGDPVSRLTPQQVMFYRSARQPGILPAPANAGGGTRPKTT
jgi:hypothetical protein